MDQTEKFLSELPLFKGFSPADLQKLIESSEVKTFLPQEVVISFGQPGRFLGVVISGEAEALFTDKTGTRKRLGLLKRGDFLGEMSLLTGEPTSADVIALEKSQILVIPQETFSTYLVVNPGAVSIIAKTITQRLRNRQQDEEAQARVEDAWRSSPDPYGLNLSTDTPMKILILNCGSSSLKYGYYDTAQQMNNCEGIVERIGLGDSRIISKSRKGKTSKDLGHTDHNKAFKVVIAQLTDPDEGVIKDLNELNAVGHRVVHGGDKYSGAVIINEDVIDVIDKNSILAPLHNPLNLLIIKQSMNLMPQVPQVAVFDTGFHQSMPQHSYLYGLPYDFYEKDRIRRYGFHGISHNYVALQAAAYLKSNFKELKIITCHLGNGASISAIDHGRSVDTTMGLTPLEGLLMGTRCGDLDPSIIIHLMREKGLSAEETDEILNRQSGLKGLSGISSDLREVEEAAGKGDQRALLTLDVFCYRIRKYIGAYVAALGGLDVLVFTGGIGEGSSRVRSLSCQGLLYMGIMIDNIRNKEASLGEVVEISDENSQIKILVVPTDEERMIAREAIRAIGYRNVAKVIEKKKEKEIPIETSAHHVHLSKEDVDKLFGQGHELTFFKELSQPGQFACKEIVNLIGPKGRVERVRILGPVRNKSQVEISMTEEFKLGIKAPIRASGDLEGTPGIILEGPEGICEISEGVICALRHIHATPEDALSFGLKDRDISMVKVEGERTLVFGDVLVRVSPDFSLNMHIDTDEANSASINTGMTGDLVGVQDRR
ncbi:acetate/propionate family kinase [Thermodesulfobacteriota bacterium]